jgi:hypothetical protein
MDDSLGVVWFFGDLSDPWVGAIADALPYPASLIRVDCPSELSSSHKGAAIPPRLIVVHRARLVPADLERLKEWRRQVGSEPPPALMLCVGPYVRYDELEPFSGFVDLVLSEATACDVLARHAARLLDDHPIRSPRVEGNPNRILVASSNGELRRTIAEACATAGYRVEQASDEVIGEPVRSTSEQSITSGALVTVWDVPVLEPWTDRLERHAREHGPVVALIGFPDRSTVALAKSKGAIACLELPLNLDDLIDVIERCARLLASEPQPMPGRVERPHILPPRSRRRAADKVTPAQEIEWPAR